MGKDQINIDAGLLAGPPLRLTITTTNTSYQLKPGDQCVLAITALADALAIIILPALGDSAGKFYYIEATTGATGGDISLYEKETGAELATNGDMDADLDYLVLYSTGARWITVVDGVA